MGNRSTANRAARTAKTMNWRAKLVKTRRRILASALFLLLGAACGPLGSDDKPSVEILSPPDQYSLSVGESLQVESHAVDDHKLGKIALYVNGLLVHDADTPDDAKTFRALQNWRPGTAGQYKIAVVAYDSQGHASDPAAISISVKAAPRPVVTSTPSPTPTAAPAAQSADPTPVPCTYNASFVADVTIPDNTQLPPGTEFVKTWRLRNSGTCNWGQGFKFVFIEGERMSAPDAVDAPPTAAGETVDISILFKAPQEPGAHKSRWRIRSANGQDFGERPFVLVRVAAPGPTPGPDSIELSIIVAPPPFNGAGEANSKTPMSGAFYCMPSAALETNQVDKTDEPMRQCIWGFKENGESWVLNVFCP
jgi:hypothetical protein